jgi:hypothetical protein
MLCSTLNSVFVSEAEESCDDGLDSTCSPNATAVSTKKPHS